MRKQVERVERKKKLMVYFMGIVMISSVFGVIFFWLYEWLWKTEI